MRYSLALLACLLCPIYSKADAGKELQYDSVSIGYIPSKAGYHKGEPGVVHVAKTLRHHKNQEMATFYAGLSDLASQGIKHNGIEIHGATHYIDAEYQGQRLRLFFDGNSGLSSATWFPRLSCALKGKQYAYSSRGH